MIPKNIYFIWFGEKVPYFFDNVLNVYKNIYKDYNIEYIHEINPYNSNNLDIRDCIDQINTNNTFYHNFYNRKFAKKFLINKNGFNTRLSDCFRFYLLYKYGGIYLDCDTFPVRLFDLNVLNNKGYCCKIKYNNIIYNDIYFMGSEPGIKIFEDKRLVDKCVKKQLVCDYIKSDPVLDVDYFLNNTEYNSLYNKFINGNIKYGDTYNRNCYIDHYFNNSWR